MNRVIAGFGLCLALSNGAVGSPIDPAALMGSFNLIVLNNLDAQSETEGTVFVGGNAAVNGYGVNPDKLPAGSVGGVTGAFIVGGSLSGGSVVVQQGGVFVGGSNSASISHNGPAGSNAVVIGGANSGTVQTSQPGSITVGGASSGQLNAQGGTVQTNAGAQGTVPVAAVKQAFEKLSQDLLALPATPGAQALSGDQNNLRVISGAGGAGGFAVVHAPAALVTNGTFVGVFDSTGSKANVPTIVNVAGTQITIGANFNQTLSNVLFNFYEATTLNVNASFNYSILAPLATVTAQGGGTNGVVVALNLTQRTEIRPIEDKRLFDGRLPGPPAPVAPVPLPAGLVLALTGVAALVLGRRTA